MTGYINTDKKCYTSILDDNSLNLFLDANYTKRTITYENTIKAGYKVGDVGLCSKFAIDNSKKYFLISDFVAVPGSNDFSYNCYIPKNSDECGGGGGGGAIIKDQSVFKPFADTLYTLLGLPNQQFSSNSQNIVPVANVKTISGGSDIVKLSQETNNKCFQYTLNNDVFRDGESSSYFAKRGNFYIYKTSLVYPSKNANGEADLMDNLKLDHNFNYYKTILEKNFGNKAYNPILLDLERTMKNYFCTGSRLTQANETYFDDAITNLNNYYAARFGDLGAIVTDISKLTHLASSDTDYLESLDGIITNKEGALNSLKGFDGANDGKLSDRQFLRSMKLYEINIICLILVFVIFVFAKTRR